MKTKVLHVFEYFSQGGIENFVMNVFRNIDRDKYEFHFAFINKDKGYFDDEAISLGGQIHYFDSTEKTFKNYKTSLTRIIKEYGPFDVIHSHMYYFSGYILKIAKKCGVPIRIAHSHETSKGRKNTLLRRMYESHMRSLIMKNSNCLLACSKLAGEFVFHNKKKVTVLYNGIDVNRFAFDLEARNKIRKELWIKDDVKLLLNVGRFSDQKNQLFLADVFNEYYKLNNNSKLVLVGYGDLENVIKEKVREYGLEDSVIFTGSVFNTEDYYSASDIYVMPSKYEGLGIVAVEAQVSGLISLASLEVPEEVNETGLLSFMSLDKSPMEWASKIDELLKSKVNRSEYVNKVKDTPFDINKTVALLCEVYDGKHLDE